MPSRPNPDRPPSVLLDADARQAIRHDLETTLVVEAAAGTGKTTELVRRIVALVAQGQRLSRMAAVTFTDKAAGEMKLRLRQALEVERKQALAAAESERVGHLNQALAELEVARIGTIHAFCADLLRERPIEAKVDPSFAMASEDQVGALLDRAFADWFQRTLAAPPKALTRLLRRAGLNEKDSASQALRRAAQDLVEDRDFDAPWPKPPDFERSQAIEELLQRLHAMHTLAELGQPRSKLVAAVHVLTVVATDTAERERRVQRGRDEDGLEAQLMALLRAWDGWKHKGYPREFPEGVRDELLAQREAFRAALEAFAQRVEAELASEVRELLREVVHAYEELKARAGWLDFADLLLRTRDLLVQDAAVREAWQRSFTHLFVDEFQDTDPLQADILLLLASDPEVPLVFEEQQRASTHRQEAWPLAQVTAGKLFVVGDPKQSIYRFRRADVRIYERVKRHLEQAGAQVLYLRTSFRSLPGIQAVVNQAFERTMLPTEDGTQAQYVALESFRPAPSSQPSVVALPAPRVRVWQGGPTKTSVDASLPDATAAFVAWLVRDSGWKVAEGDALVPVDSRHICLLFKSLHSSYKEDPVRAYIEGLEARQVPHVLMGGRTFHDREEVAALRQALLAIEWPDDDVALYATLHGPLFALRDDVLLAYKSALGSLSPLRRLSDEQEAWLLDHTELLEVHEALEVLKQLHRRRNRRHIAETINELLAQTRAHASLAFWPSGEQALANVLRVVDHGRRFDARGNMSFRAFVTWLEGASETDRSGGNAPIVEDGADGVRVMTVHKAKGLEFPVVILCSPTDNAVFSRPSRWVDPAAGLAVRSLAGCLPQTLSERHDEVMAADRAEALRLLYVASTRARDLLVVPTTGLGEHDNWWTTPLAKALHPDPKALRKSEPAPTCPRFGESSVVDAEQPEQSVRPGLHPDLAGGHGVVWWDPALLDAAPPLGGSRNTALLVEDDEGHALEGAEVYHAWKASHHALRATAARPRHPARPVTQVSKDPLTPTWAPDTLNVKVEQSAASLAAAAQPRPQGARFGTLVHALLAELPLDAPPALARQLARAHGRVLGASAEEIEAAALAALSALEHPLMQRAAVAAAAGGLRRETPILLRAPHHEGAGEGPEPITETIVEGIVDLAFLEEGRWVVADFKTDLHSFDTPAQSYLIQVRLYAEAITAATGQPATPILFGV